MSTGWERRAARTKDGRTKCLFLDPTRKLRNNIKMGLKGRGLRSSYSEQGPAVETCERGFQSLWFAYKNN
jgi:hypothetical protein